MRFLILAAAAGAVALPASAASAQYYGGRLRLWLRQQPRPPGAARVPARAAPRRQPPANISASCANAGARSPRPAATNIAATVTSDRYDRDRRYWDGYRWRATAIDAPRDKGRLRRSLMRNSPFGMTPEGDASMAGSLSRWRISARIAKVDRAAAVRSALGDGVLRGADTGHDERGRSRHRPCHDAANPMGGSATESPPGMNGGDICVIPGALLILAGLAASFVLKGRNGLIADMAGAGLAAAALAYTVLVRIPHQTHAGAARPDRAGRPEPGADRADDPGQGADRLLADPAGPDRGDRVRRAGDEATRRPPLPPPARGLRPASSRPWPGRPRRRRRASAARSTRSSPPGRRRRAAGRLRRGCRRRRRDRRGQRRRGAEQAGVDRVDTVRASCRSARSRRRAPISTLVASSMSSSGPARSRSTASVSAAAGAAIRRRTMAGSNRWSDIVSR